LTFFGTDCVFGVLDFEAKCPVLTLRPQYSSGIWCHLPQVCNPPGCGP